MVMRGAARAKENGAENHDSSATVAQKTRAAKSLLRQNSAKAWREGAPPPATSDSRRWDQKVISYGDAKPLPRRLPLPAGGRCHAAQPTNAAGLPFCRRTIYSSADTTNRRPHFRQECEGVKTDRPQVTREPGTNGAAVQTRANEPRGNRGVTNENRKECTNKCMVRE